MRQLLCLTFFVISSLVLGNPTREFPTVVIDEEFRKESLLKEVLVESNGQRVVVSDTLDLLKLTTDTCWIYFRLVNTTNSDQSLIFEPGNNKFEYFSLYCNMNSEPTFLFGADDNEMSESSEINLSALDTCYFGVEVCQVAGDEWVSLDGKELRGSLEVREDGTKDKRGEVVVNAVRHKDSKVVGQVFYRGDKEREKPAVRELLEKSGLKKSR